MSYTGRYYTTIIDNTGKSRTFCIEPISEFPDRNADWTNGGIDEVTGGALLPQESLITNDKFKNIYLLKPGESPNGFIKDLIENS